MKQSLAEIKKIEAIKKDIYKFSIEEKYISETSVPGQFLNIKCSDDSGMVLRRPISIYNTCPEKGIVEFVFQLRGKGTHALSKRKEGELIDVMGPLGKGFDLSEKYEKVALVGGGIGIFPLYFTAKRQKARVIDYYAGFKSVSDVVLMDEFKKISTDTFLCSNDGSCGEKGFVTDSFERNYLLKKYDMVYVCGPEIMMQKVSGIVHSQNKTCQILMEGRMACAIGACLVCACQVKRDEEMKMVHICKDGPVFKSSEVFYE